MTQYQGNDVFPAGFEEVNDGTGRDAASVNIGLEALADRTVFLRNVGFRRVRQWVFDNDAGPTPVWSFSSTTFAPNVTDPAAWVVLVEGTRVGDVIAVDALVPITAPAGTNAFVRIGETHNALGGGLEAHVPGFGRIGAGNSGTVTMATHTTVTAAGVTRLRLLGRYTGAGPSFAVVGFGMLRATLLRPSGSAA